MSQFAGNQQVLAMKRFPDLLGIRGVRANGFNCSSIYSSAFPEAVTRTLVTAVIATWTGGNAAFPDVLEPLFARQIGKGFAEWEIRKVKWASENSGKGRKAWLELASVREYLESMRNLE